MFKTVHLLIVKLLNNKKNLSKIPSKYFSYNYKREKKNEFEYSVA